MMRQLYWFDADALVFVERTEGGVIFNEYQEVDLRPEYIKIGLCQVTRVQHYGLRTKRELLFTDFAEARTWAHQRHLIYVPFHVADKPVTLEDYVNLGGETLWTRCLDESAPDIDGICQAEEELAAVLAQLPESSC